MKDYSMNAEERKDFILGYTVDEEGNMIINFANGDKYPMSFNEKNEKIVLDKMKQQIGNSKHSSEISIKINKKVETYGVAFALCLMVSLPGFLGFNIEVSDVFRTVCYCIIGGAFTTSIIPLVNLIKNQIKLNDLKKNISFLEIEQKLNDNIRKNNNALVNVSKKTKEVIKEFPEDRPVFNINSFNYVPYKDIEQIMENIERNERFGFDYEGTEKVINDPIMTRTRRR